MPSPSAAVTAPPLRGKPFERHAAVRAPAREPLERPLLVRAIRVGVSLTLARIAIAAARW
jgi:hypothetical protein